MKEVFIEGLFPRFCIRCAKEGTLFCFDCESAYMPGPVIDSCVFCGRPGFLGRTCHGCSTGTYLDGSVSLGPYGDRVLRKAISTWKYHGDGSLRSHIFRWIRASGIAGRFTDGFDFVTHVPLHKARRRERGFDQAEELALEISRNIGVSHANLLQRAHWTEPQARLSSGMRRLGQMDDIFTVKQAVSGRVLLCDDVVTSGATIDSAALALKRAGASSVWAFSLARGRPHRRP